jgi:putative glutamine amidotransferase
MKRPIIAITPSYDETRVAVGRRYMDAVQKSGGTPLLLNLTFDKDVMEHYAMIADGFLFTGGDDVAPIEYGETVHEGFGDYCLERDTLEIPLAKRVFELGKPMMGICRGIQTLNVAFGGTLIQDIPIEFSKKMVHSQQPPYSTPSHTVKVLEGSFLHGIVGVDELKVNSMHHQAVKKMADGWKTCAVAPDGIIEAMERTDYPFALGIQWHPEHLFPVDEKAQLIFKKFIDSCK